MARSPVIQMQNWFMHNQQWLCAPLTNNDQFWTDYTESLQDAAGRPQDPFNPFMIIIFNYSSDGADQTRVAPRRARKMDGIHPDGINPDGIADGSSSPTAHPPQGMASWNLRLGSATHQRCAGFSDGFLEGFFEELHEGFFFLRDSSRDCLKDSPWVKIGWKRFQRRLSIEIPAGRVDLAFSGNNRSKQIPTNSNKFHADKNQTKWRRESADSFFSVPISLLSNEKMNQYSLFCCCCCCCCCCCLI